MKLKNALGSFALAALVAAGASGCVVRAHGRIGVPVGVVMVEEEPPPPRVVRVDVRPGFIYIQGRWVRNGGRWVWRDGRYERQRANQQWEQGRWERRGRNHVWVEGRWRAGGRVEHRDNGPAVRDHRDNRRRNDPPPPSGPVVRDHR
jgi:hypothetical protein